MSSNLANGHDETLSRRPTLADIAREVGVSTATVSLALSGSPLVAKQTARRVREAARRQNYRPHAIARRLSTGRSEVMSLFVLGGKQHSSRWLLSSSWMFYSLILKGLSVTLGQHGYNLQLRILGDEVRGWPSTIVEHAMERGTDGIFLLLQDRDEHSTLDELANLSLEVPMVTINCTLARTVSSVQVSNEQGAGDIVNYLVSLGHRKIAHIAGPSDSFNAEDRRAGYLASMGKAGLAVPDGYLVEGDWQMQSGYQLVQNLMALPVPPTAIVCSNDHMAVGALEALRGMGIRVPDEVSLVGFDDTEISSVVTPRLTTVRQPLEEVGIVAANQVLAWDRDVPSPAQHTVLVPRLIERESCKRLPG